MEKLNKADIERIEELHDLFRDKLIDLREHLTSTNDSIHSDQSKEIKLAMDSYIKECKSILIKNKIKNEFELKEVSKKFFIPDFLNLVFDIDLLYVEEDEIDCGL